MRSHTESNRAFLLRCWRENNDLGNSRTRWRFSLEEVSPRRERRGFVALEDLLAFLRREFEDAHHPADSTFERGDEAGATHLGSTSHLHMTK